MAPAESISTFPDLLDPLDLLDGVVGDLLAEGGLPPMAGGQDFGPLGDAWDWVRGNVIEPSGDFLRDVLSEIGRTVAAAVTTILTWAAKGVYELARDVILPLVHPAYRVLFPRPMPGVSFGPLTYGAWILRMLAFAVWSIVNDVAGWLWEWVQANAVAVIRQVGDRLDWGWDWVWAVGQGVERRIGDVGDWLWQWVQANAAAVVSQIGDAIGWLRDWVGDVGAAVAGAVRDVGNWLWDWVQANAAAVVSQVGDAIAWLSDWVWQVGQGVERRIDDAIDWLWRNVLSKVGDAVIAGAAEIGQLIRGAFEWVVNSAFEPFVDVVEAKLAIPGKLIRGEYTSLAELVDDMLDPPREMLKGWTGMMMFPFIVIGLLVNLVTGLSSPLLEPMLQEQRRSVGAQLLSPAQIHDAWNRELISEGTAVDLLRRWGFGHESLDAVQELRHQIPGSSDLVRFAVREAFDPGLADQLGFVTPLPGDFALWMERQGFAEEWAERYWWAHWDLPSVTQAFAMLHRGVIQLEDLKLLLRAQDVAPLWQDRLVDIAYTLPSRVDLRRMLKTDIITEAEVLEGYTKRGYDSFWAQALTDFAVAWATPEDKSDLDDLRDLTASQIRLAYRRNVIDREEALDRLVEIDYSEVAADLLLAVDDAQLAINPFGEADVDVRELTRAVILQAYREGVWDRDRAQIELEAQGYLPGSADLFLTLEDVKVARSLTRAQTDLVRQRYVTYELDDAGARADLAALEIPVARRELLVAEWAVDRQAGTRNLSLSQIRNAVKEGLIDHDDALARTLRLGYTLEDSTIIRVLAEPQLDAARELSRGLVERLLRTGQITTDQAVDRLQRLGFTGDDARAIVASLERQMERSLVERLLKQGLIDRDDGLERLQRVGYGAQDAELIVLSVEAKLAEAAAKEMA